MAMMPKGEPRSVSDPLAEPYDEMIRAATRDGFSPPTGRLDFNKPAGEGGGYVKIGDRWYRSAGNGQANVLVPADNPSYSPAELAQRREAVERALFDASQPMAGVASGFAALVGASSEARDVARVIGAAADTALSFGASRTPPAPRAARSGQVSPPPEVRPGIRYGELNAKGQATGVNATITESMIGTGTKANRRLYPPGWSGNGTLHNESRGHLYANILGGSGGETRNMVTLTQYPMNSPWMRDFEVSMARKVRNGEIVEYFGIPLYGNGPAPAAILLTAHGSKSGTSAKVIGNPAGRRK